MADKEHKPTIGTELQEEIANFQKGNLQQTQTKEYKDLPDAATIEAEKKAEKAMKEASGQ